MGIEKMIRSVQTLMLEIAVPGGVLSDFYIIFRTCLYQFKVNTALGSVEDRWHNVGLATLRV